MRVQVGPALFNNLRSVAVPYIVPLQGPEQQGARPKGGTEFPVTIRRFFPPMGKKWRFGRWTVLRSGRSSRPVALRT